MKFELTPSVFGYAESTSPGVEATGFAETFQGFPLRGSCHEVTDEVAEVSTNYRLSLPPLVARGGDFRKKIGGDKKEDNLMKFSAFHLIRAAQSAAHLLLKEKAVKLAETPGAPIEGELSAKPTEGFEIKFDEV